MTQPSDPQIHGPLQPQYQLPPAPPPPKQKRFGWPMLISVAVASWFIGAIMIGVAGNSTPTAEPSIDISEFETTGSEATSTPRTSSNTITNGTWEVSVDVKAGQYKTNIPDGEYCYWERSSDDAGDLDSIIANDSVDGPARASVTIKKGEFFKSDDCGTWVKVG